VSSTAHRIGRIRFDDLQGEQRYGRWRAYGQSKLANLLFALELDRRLRAAGSPVKSLLAHPGYSATNLQVSGPTGLVKQVLRLGNALLAQSADDGAIPQLYAATAPGVESGEFIGPDGFGEYRGKHPRRVDATDRAHDEELARRLWEVSEGLTGVTYPLARRARA
jgi:NAD(P)-dependent dehydrogenase (short-subunit alcohol dehydrogenase family)